MDVRIINDRAEFTALESAWDALLAASGARPFQEFGWADAWMSTIGSTGGRRLNVVTAWDGATLVGVWPLTLRRFKGVRILEWIGARETDYCDVLLAPRIERRAALRQMWEKLRRCGNFDVLRMGQVRSDASVRELLTDLTPWVETREHSDYIPISWPDSDSWLKAQSKKSRARVRRGMRQMEELGLEFHIWKPGEPLESLIGCVIEQKLAWIAARKVESFLTAPEGAQFIRELAAVLAKSGSLHLSVLRSQDGVVASHLGFYRDRTLYYYMPTYDAAWAKHSVGTVLRDALVMWACDNGAAQFDMLRGEHDYKSQYDAAAEELQTLVVPRGLVGRAALSLYRFRQRARAA